MGKIDKELIEAYKPHSVLNLGVMARPFVNKTEIDGLQYIHPYLQAGISFIVGYLESIPKDVSSIMIFGSCLTYNARRDSDIDIYVAVKNDCDKIRQLEVYKEISKFMNIDTGFDLVVATEKDFLERCKRLNSTERAVLIRGFEIYKREGAWESE